MEPDTPVLNSDLVPMVESQQFSCGGVSRHWRNLKVLFAYLFDEAAMCSGQSNALSQLISCYDVNFSWVDKKGMTIVVSLAIV